MMSPTPTARLEIHDAVVASGCLVLTREGSAWRVGRRLSLRAAVRCSGPTSTALCPARTRARTGANARPHCPLHCGSASMTPVPNHLVARPLLLKERKLAGPALGCAVLAVLAVLPAGGYGRTHGRTDGRMERKAPTAPSAVIFFRPLFFRDHP